jgi:hypothetical protein
LGRTEGGNELEEEEDGGGPVARQRRFDLPRGQGAGAEDPDEGILEDRGHGGDARDSRDSAEKRKTCSGG